MPRQELVQALQLLDMNVYNNVFIGEQNGQGKPGSGAAACSAPICAAPPCWPAAGRTH